MSPFAKVHLKSITNGSEFGLLKEYESNLIGTDKMNDTIIEYIKNGKVLGIQIHAMQNGKVAVDTCGGLKCKHCIVL